MTHAIPATTIPLNQSGASTTSDALGMREMQARAYRRRGEQYLLIKSPPASGKSRALMFIALDKLHKQGVEKAVILVPERSIGSSFSDTPLSRYGFFRDWNVEPRWNICNADDTDHSTNVKAVEAFLESDSRILVCTHATFRRAFAELGVEAWDSCLLAVDEFHHVSTSGDNVLGAQLGEVIARGHAHIVAMTGSYFRGDAAPILHPEDEAKFATVQYTYFEQLNGYEHLRSLGLNYAFYEDGDYLGAMSDVLDSSLKTIVHIPSVNSSASTQRGKIAETNAIMGAIGRWTGTDPDTGFQLVVTEDGRTLRIADLVDDGPHREQVAASLKDPRANADRDWVDIIIALGMAKEGFDWVWCEHALTVGYRSSLTEIVQIIGRATRDAPGKSHAQFTNLIALPAAEQGAVADAVNDTLKAIGASLLMEQVLTPDVKAMSERAATGPTYAEAGSSGQGTLEVGEGPQKAYEIAIKGLAEPVSDAGKKACSMDSIRDLFVDAVQDKRMMEQSLLNDDLVPEELTRVHMMNIVRKRNPDLPEEDQEAVRQRVVAMMSLPTMAARGNEARARDGDEIKASTALIDGVKRYEMDVRELDVDLIDSIRPFGDAYQVFSRQMDSELLEQLRDVIRSRKVSMTYQESREWAEMAKRFLDRQGRAPKMGSSDPLEQKMAEGVAAYVRHVKARQKAEAAA